jgi:hypothetical protein
MAPYYKTRKYNLNAHPQYCIVKRKIMFLRICKSFKTQKIRSDPLIPNLQIANNIGP